MVQIENGTIVDERVEIRTYPSIEHGDIERVRSIVLHRTDSSTAAGTLNAYANGKKTGAHFLIEKAGHIYQTASMQKVCWHVGILLPRCKMENSCSPRELKTITALIREDGLSFGRRARNLSRHEKNKNYPLRYPTNHDAIGIEVVGKFWPADAAFEKPTSRQLDALKWLVGTLLNEYGLKLRDDVYAHGAIARKEASEGAQLLHYLFLGATS